MLLQQHVKKVVSDSPGLVDFAVGLENPVLNLVNTILILVSRAQV